LLLVTATLTNAQTVRLSAGVEKTAIKSLYGGRLTLESKSKWGVGAFFQNSFLRQPHESGKLSGAFYGVLFQVPFAKTDKIDFFAIARLGFVNVNYFVAVPGFETRIKTLGQLSTFFGMGYRSGYPSISAGLSHPLF
jgi:hypothetical protein